jgi:hypothetical protein
MLPSVEDLFLTRRCRLRLASEFQFCGVLQTDVALAPTPKSRFDYWGSPDCSHSKCLRNPSGAERRDSTFEARATSESPQKATNLIPVARGPGRSSRLLTCRRTTRDARYLLVMSDRHLRGLGWLLSAPPRCVSYWPSERCLLARLLNANPVERSNCREGLQREVQESDIARAPFQLLVGFV